MYSNPFREVYKRSGLTQEQIAAQSGLSKGAIERLLSERGILELNHAPNLKTMLELAEFFKHRLIITLEPLNGREASDGKT